NGITGELRRAWDRVLNKVSSRGGNPYRVGDPGFRVFEEVRKHEAMLRSRMSRLAHLLEAGETRAASLLHDQLAFYEGELAFWKREAQEIEAGRGSKVLGEGIEAQKPAQVHLEALRQGYPKLKEGQLYRRTGNPDEPFEAYTVESEAAA